LVARELLAQERNRDPGRVPLPRPRGRDGGHAPGVGDQPPPRHQPLGRISEPVDLVRTDDLLSSTTAELIDERLRVVARVDQLRDPLACTLLVLKPRKRAERGLQVLLGGGERRLGLTPARRDRERRRRTRGRR
jgi:hypothetical protein